jgi:hypothetical protein
MWRPKNIPTSWYYIKAKKTRGALAVFNLSLTRAGGAFAVERR